MTYTRLIDRYRSVGMATVAGILAVPGIFGAANADHSGPRTPVRQRQVASMVSVSNTVVVGGLDDPTALQITRDGRMLVTERAGRIVVLRDGLIEPAPMLIVEVARHATSGLGGLLLDPEFESTGFIYVRYTPASAPGRERISRFKVTGDTAVPGSEKILLTVNASKDGRARDARLFIGLDGTLLVPLAGDRVTGGGRGTSGQLLRINRDGTIPQDAPRSADGRTRQWITGLREPTAMAFHALTGRAVLADRVAPSGFAIREPRAGSDFSASDGDADELLRLPPGRRASERCGITAGHFYEPEVKLFPGDWHDVYLFANSCTRAIHWLKLSTLTTGVVAAGLAPPIDLAVAGDGALYYLAVESSNQQGSLHRLTPAAPTPPPQPTSPTTWSPGDQTSHLGATAAARVVVRTSSELQAALRSAVPGTTVALNPGVYNGDNYFEDLTGTATAPIIIEAADPSNRPIIRGGYNGLQLVRPKYVTIRRIVFEQQEQNGINIDDGEIFDSPAHHLVLSELVVRDIRNTGNADGIKLSGVQDSTIEDSLIARWGAGGSAIDMVGSHRILIQRNTFTYTDNLGATGPSMKGGSTGIIIRENRFDHAGLRAVQIGGVHTLRTFRPQPPANYEAKDCVVERNVFIGSEAAVTFVNIDGSTFRFNTIYRPGRWLARILQEQLAPGFVPSRNGIVTDNIVYYEGSDFPYGPINVGSGTDAPSFTFARNWWYRADLPSASRPSLPAVETNGVYGVNPQFVNASGGDFHLAVGSPATAYGAYAVTSPTTSPPRKKRPHGRTSP